MEDRMIIARHRREAAYGELLFNGYRFAIVQDEKRSGVEWW